MVKDDLFAARAGRAGALVTWGVAGVGTLGAGDGARLRAFGWTGSVVAVERACVAAARERLGARPTAADLSQVARHVLAHLVSAGALLLAQPSARRARHFRVARVLRVVAAAAFPSARLHSNVFRSINVPKSSSTPSNEDNWTRKVG